MTSDPIDRVFGRGRLKMTTGPHVEVFREAAAPGEARRYTKRFLTTADGDYAQWTEREWRILARLIGHGSRSVPDVVQYDRDAHGTKLVQTYDAGATVDQWATLLPVERDGRVHAHVFEDCAHWWALAHHCLAALDEIHSLGLVHLDVKGDNVCIPIGPPDFDAATSGQRLFPVFRKLALIDFAFSLVAGEALASPLPIGWQQDYDYQSPRLLHALEAGRAGDLRPTEALDWRCDMYSLAAMLKRYLPREPMLDGTNGSCGWTRERYDAAKALILGIREAHDADLAAPPHVELMLETSAQLRTDELARSLEQGWTLARDVQPHAVAALPLTPVTRLAPPLRVVLPTNEEHREPQIGKPLALEALAVTVMPPPPARRSAARASVAALGIGAALGAIALATGWVEGDALQRIANTVRSWSVPMQQPKASRQAEIDSEPATVAAAGEQSEPVTAPATETVPQQPDNPAPVVAPSLPSEAPARSATPAPGETFAEQIEAYREKPAVRGARDARTPPRKSMRASEVPKRPPPVVAAKPMRSPAPSRQFASAAKRPTAPTAVAARTTTPRPPIAVAPPVPAGAFASSPPAPAAVPVDPPQVVANQSTPVPAAVAPPPAAASADVRAASIAEPVPVKPAVEAARAAAPRSTTPGLAPIVEASRPLAPRTVVIARRDEREAIAEPAPRAAAEPPRDTPREPSAASDSPGEQALVRHARYLIAEALPRSSAQAQARVAHVLAMAAYATYPAQEAALSRAASAVGSTGLASLPPAGTRDNARRLHDRSRHAYRALRHVPEAFELGLAAFAADPNDADIAGHLAFLHLKVLPAQPERARQLALHAIGIRSAAESPARADDWTTFAIASALTGRAAEARHAWFTVLAVSRDVERTCRTALGALTIHGERLRDPVDAMLQRLRAQGRSDDVPACAAPVERMASAR